MSLLTLLSQPPQVDLTGVVQSVGVRGSGAPVNAGAAPTISVPIPENYPNDILMMTAVASASGTVTTPAGWTLLGQDATGTAHTYVFWRLINLPLTGSVALTVSTAASAVITCLYGASSSPPTGIVTKGATSGATITANAQRYTQYVYWGVGVSNLGNSTNESASAGNWFPSEEADTSGIPSVVVNVGSIDPGTTASLTMTRSASNNWGSIAVSIEPSDVFAPLPMVEWFPDADASPWPTSFSTHGDTYAPQLWDFPFGQNNSGTWTAGPNWTLAMEYNNTHSPGGAVALTRNTATAGSGYLLNASTNIQSGMKHYLSFWVFTNTPTVHSVKIAPKTSGNVAVGSPFTFDFVAPVGRWFKQTVYFTAPAAPLADIYLTDDGNLTPSVGDKIIYDDIELGYLSASVYTYYTSGWMKPNSANAYIRMDAWNNPLMGDTNIRTDFKTDPNQQHTAIVGINGDGSGQSEYYQTGYSVYVAMSAGGGSTATVSIRGDGGALLSNSIVKNIGSSWTRVRLKRIGNVVKARVWDAFVAEPTTWAVTYTIPGTPVLGRPYLAHIAGSAGAAPDLFWDQFFTLVSTADSDGVDSSGGGGTTITPVSQVGAFQAAGSASNSVTVNAPAGVVQGNLLIAVMSFNTDATIPAQAGWTQALQVDNAAGALLGVFYKIATASEPATYTFSGTASTSSEPRQFQSIP